MKNQEIENLLRTELRDIMTNVIWRNDNGEYEVFGKYLIVPKKNEYQVWSHATLAGTFTSTKTAVSWCVADKYQNFNLARKLLLIDNALGNLTNDIFVRAGMANRTKKPQFREDIETKLETKIIKKRQLETELSKCVELAKYLQIKGFANETARTGRSGTNKTSR